ncbi:MAG: hypothetical protein Q8Q60_01020 [Candidatus Chromulinivorax sp.]|nr:hypothetical protein [Candidatus Chromulinivorax sp.]
MKNSKKIMLIALLAMQTMTHTKDDQTTPEKSTDTSSRTWQQAIYANRYNIFGSAAIAALIALGYTFQSDFATWFNQLPPEKQAQATKIVETSMQENLKKIEQKQEMIAEQTSELEKITERKKHSTQANNAHQKDLDDKLISAVYDNNIDSLKVALYEGANPNSVKKVSGIFWNSKITPLEAAVRQNHGEELQLLLAHGATTDGLNDQDKATLNFMLHKNDPKFMNMIHPIEIRGGVSAEQNSQEGDELDRFLAPFIKKYKENKGEHFSSASDSETQKKEDLAYQIVKKVLIETPKPSYWGRYYPLDEDDRIAKFKIAAVERLHENGINAKYFLGNDIQSILNAKIHVSRDPNFVPSL